MQSDSKPPTEEKPTQIIAQTGLGYINRDKGVKTEEEQGLIEFIVVKNDK